VKAFKEESSSVLKEVKLYFGENGGVSARMRECGNARVRTSNIQHRTFNIERRTSNIQHRKSNKGGVIRFSQFRRECPAGQQGGRGSVQENVRGGCQVRLPEGQRLKSLKSLKWCLLSTVSRDMKKMGNCNIIRFVLSL
jgi:hypothetical protein